MIQKTEAIVLRTINYSDQSKIITLFSKEFGKISAIAKGYKKPNSKTASLFEVGNYVEVILYVKPHRQMQLISDGNLKASFLTNEHSLESYSSLHQIVELLRLATEEGEKHVALFNLLLRTINALSKPHINTICLLFYFQIHLISQLGFEPGFFECAYTKKPITPQSLSMGEKKLVLVPELGGICHLEHSNAYCYKKPSISMQAYQILLKLSCYDLSKIENFFIDKNVSNEVYRILDTYIRFHVEHLPPLRSREISLQLLS